MTQILRARRLLTEQGWLADHQLRMEAGVITAIEPVPVGVTARDADLLCPAYIDTHVHGGAGIDVMDEAPEALDRLAMYKTREGVGAWLPTTVTAPLQAIVMGREPPQRHHLAPGQQGDHQQNRVIIAFACRQQIPPQPAPSGSWLQHREGLRASQFAPDRLQPHRQHPQLCQIQ